MAFLEVVEAFGRAVVAALLAFFGRTTGPGIEPPPPEILGSIVVLLPAPQSLDVATVHAAARRVFGGSPEVTELPQEAGVHSFAIRGAGRRFAVFCSPRPYADETQADAQTDRAIANALRTHRAWMSVDDEGTEEGPIAGPPDVVYPLLGRLLAELAPEDALAVYCPTSDAIRVVSGAALEALLRSPELPMLVLGGEVGHDETVRASVVDPELAAAAAEARRRWPEFATAFASRGATQHFFVKAPFPTVDGGREFLWVDVSRIDGGDVQGVVANDPARVTNLRARSVVTVATADIDDWIWIEGDETHGGFTGRVLEARVR